jgi:hypothetical protein
VAPAGRFPKFAQKLCFWAAQRFIGAIKAFVLTWPLAPAVRSAEFSANLFTRAAYIRIFRRL